MKNEIVNKSALILTADIFEDLEVFYPLFRLKEEGWKVTVAAPALEEIHGKHGYKLKPDARIDEVNPDDYSILILPGGSKDGAPGIVRNLKAAHDIARNFFERNKLVAAICHGPYTLISADIVKGKKLTSYQRDGVPEEIKNAGGTWIDAEVVMDGNLVTSRRPGDLPAFMKEIFRIIERESKLT